MLISSWVKRHTTPPVPAPSPVVETPVIPTEKVLTTEKGIQIFITSPKENISIGNPLHIEGRAPGNWFFEASAPVTLTNWDGLIIAEGYITAIGDWMTTDYVPFSGDINFTKPDYGANGFLILQKDNPSDMPENDDSAQMTIQF